MNKKFFAFGCSFTRYHWPTWADIIGSNFTDNFFNYGKSGAGNLYIYIKIMECLSSGAISSNDLVIVCWTNVLRDDRYIGSRWVCPGNLYTQQFYSSDFIKKYVDVEGYYIRDLALIYGASRALINNGCNFKFISMVPIDNFDQYNISKFDSRVLEIYSEVINSIEANFFKFFNFDWTNPSIENVDVDKHPLPKIHLQFVEKYFPQFDISEDYKKKITDITTLIKNIQYSSKQEFYEKLRLVYIDKDFITTLENKR